MNSPHTASGYYTIYDSETLQADHFNTRLSFGDAAQTLWARTGYLGFVRRTELTAATGGMDGPARSLPLLTSLASRFHLPGERVPLCL